jgi:4-oxalocrotonate tautomerase
MPYVNIKVTEEGVTAGQNPATTVVVIDEVHTDNWGIGGETVTVRRQRGQ